MPYAELQLSRSFHSEGIRLCRWCGISPLRFMTEPIPANDRVWHCHTVEDHGSAEPLNAPTVSPCAKVRHSARVPRAIVQRGLEDALAKDSYIRLKAVAVFVGLRSTRRFYMEKGLSD